MKRSLQYLRLFVKCFWPPVYRSRIPHALLIVLAVGVLYQLSLPSKRVMLRHHLGLTNVTVFQSVESKHRQNSPFESDAWIYLRGTSQQIQQLLEAQEFEERTGGLFGWEKHDFPVGPPLPPARNARFFHRKVPRHRHEIIITDQDLTQLWMKSSKF
jgi:hypothetical protein